MPRSKVFSAFRIRLLDPHIRIAKANDHDLSSRILNVHRALLPLARSIEWLVQCNVLAFVHVTFLGEGCFHGFKTKLLMIAGMSLSSISVSALVKSSRGLLTTFL